MTAFGRDQFHIAQRSAQARALRNRHYMIGPWTGPDRQHDRSAQTGANAKSCKPTR